MRLSYNTLIILAIIILLSSCREKEKKKTIFMDGQIITTTESDGGPAHNYTLQNLTKEQFQKIREDIDQAKVFAQKYSDQKVIMLDSENLDLILDKWKKDLSPDKLREEKVVELIGSAFGQNIVDNLDFEWKVLVDEYGTDYTVIHKVYSINGFPFSSVSKAVSQSREKSLHGIELVIKHKVQEAQKDMGYDKRMK